MCFRTDWECSKQQLSWTCLMLNIVIVYLIVGVLFQHAYVLIKLGPNYEFASLFTMLSWIEGICSLVLLVDTIFVMCGTGNLFLVSIILGFLLNSVLLISGSFSIIAYTDAYVVVRGFFSERLYYYETTHECCGINGPQDYGVPISNDTIPLSCYKHRKALPKNLYERGCLYAAYDSWFWFIFSNCYWFAFVLMIVDIVCHFKLRQRL
ncbi:uncharacterized protein LOC133844242 isoform X1 [Drosophila sulfurigaster albostrigata]|uniref:uncharacterized protein LOC133844242 isoform X1 n=1 Tax=Drosophila sulfurigaster albostrigata TaxID=89887 RepID=UPI002D21B48D|nr:uncharacterized protein LOC133844242 isoform X1 [Drosophila sulfurigaster albostrigata]